MNKEFEQGKRARYAWHNYETNPYCVVDEREKFVEWARGWNYADREYMTVGSRFVKLAVVALAITAVIIAWSVL